MRIVSVQETAIKDVEDFLILHTVQCPTLKTLQIHKEQ
jgi:hypothetical protein